MSINPVTNAAISAAGLPSTPKVHKTELDSNDFMALVMQQLRNQNPLEPMSDKDYMAQLTQMNSLQELQKMNQTLVQLTSGNKMSEAANLIGRNIEAYLPDGTAISGLVSSVSLIDDKVELIVGKNQVPLSAVVTVSAQETTQETTSHA